MFRAGLVNAIGCVKTALMRLPKNGGEAIKFNSERGRTMFKAEPGRFQRERVAAYQQALTGELQRLDALISSATERPFDKTGDNETEAQAAALFSIEVIRAQVMPLLEALAADVTGEVVAR